MVIMKLTPKEIVSIVLAFILYPQAAKQQLVETIKQLLA